MRLYYGAKKGFQCLEYHGKACRLPSLPDGSVYGVYRDNHGKVIDKHAELEYGEYWYSDPADILVPHDMNFTMMDEQSSTKQTVLCSEQEPLVPGTLVKLVHFAEVEPSKYTTGREFPLTGTVMLADLDVYEGGANVVAGDEIMSVNGNTYGIKGTVQRRDMQYIYVSDFRLVKSWNPIDRDGKPYNYSNWVILRSNSQFFDHLDVFGKRYKHTYDMEEVLTAFKDYPVRSSKTFAAGRYTYREVLDITLRLFFKPRTHYANYVIADNPVLDQPCSKLSYTQATVFDVVSDIGRILDMTPNVEAHYDVALEQYVYVVEYLNNYGAIGDEVDIKYFDLSNADTETSVRETHAGAVISNVQNLVTDEGMTYPGEGAGLFPGDTNAAGDMNIFRLPMPIQRINKITVYYRVKLNEDYVGSSVYDSQYVDYWFGEFSIKGSNSFERLLSGAELTKEDPLIITEDGSYAKPLTLTIPTETTVTEDGDYGVYASMQYTISKDESSAPAQRKQLFIAEAKVAQYLFDELPDKRMQAKDNSIVYSRGSHEVDLSALFRSYFLVGRRYFTDTNQSEKQTLWAVLRSSTEVTDNTESSQAAAMRIRPLIAINYTPYISSVLIGDSTVNSDTTVFFNQYGQVVSADSFGKAIENYADEMSGSSRIVGKIAEPLDIPFSDLYKELPQVGCTVVDHERNKRYVLSQLSITRRPQSLDLLAQLNERKKGRSQVVVADSSQYIAQIPDSEIQESKTSARFVLRISRDPLQEHISDNIVDEQLIELLINPLRQEKAYSGDVAMRLSTVDDFAMIPAKALTKDSAYFAFSFPDNRIAGSTEEGVVLYTDKNGEILDASIWLYKTSNIDGVVSNYPYFTPPSGAPVLLFDYSIRKDGYEQTNITTQLTVKPVGNLLLGGGYIAKTPFGNKADSYNDQLKILFFNRKIDGFSLYNPVVTYNAFFQWDRIWGTNEAILSWNGETPTHKAWALVSGDDCLLYSNDPIDDSLNPSEMRLYLGLDLYLL